MSELKRALREAGFEIYRTDAGEVQLAERVRENLIMDSGVRVSEGPELTVAVVTGAQQRDFQGEAPEQLFERARRSAAPLVARGYREVRATVTAVRDPGDPSRTLDHRYEVRFEKRIAALPAAIEELRALLGAERAEGAAKR